MYQTPSQKQGSTSMITMIQHLKHAPGRTCQH